MQKKYFVLGVQKVLWKRIKLLFYTGIRKKANGFRLSSSVTPSFPLSVTRRVVYRGCILQLKSTYM